MAGLAALLFPGVCPGCGAVAEPLCDGCRTALRAAPDRAPPAGLDALVVPYAYEGPVRELVARAKYRDRHGALRWLADEMATALAAAAPGVDRSRVVTWAPTTAARRRRRGFDQAELLARAIGRRLGLDVRALLRRDPSAPQTGASAAVRATQVGFRARAVSVGARVVLVDDVVTTGATMRSAARALRAAGASAVVGLASARRA